VRKPVSILDAAFKEDVEENVKPETKAAQIEHAIKREISVKMEEDEVFYTSLKEKVQDLIERFKERQMDIYELLDKLYEAREELVKKAEGKTNSGLTSDQEPYYNKLLEVFEDKRPDSELKAIAVEVQQFMETKVSPIRDWTSKTDFKRELNADMKIMFLKKKMSMSDASMLVGYFMALAEVQYK
jgi:type I restriction enzyme R subunit